MTIVISMGNILIPLLCWGAIIFVALFIIEEPVASFTIFLLITLAVGLYIINLYIPVFEWVVIILFSLLVLGVLYWIGYGLWDTFKDTDKKWWKRTIIHLLILCSPVIFVIGLVYLIKG